MSVIDGHTHVASTRFVPLPFIEGIVDNMMAQMQLSPVAVPRTRVLDHLLSSYQDHEASRQLQEMDRNGVARSILLLPDFTWALKEHSLTIEEMFVAHRRILDGHRDRFEVLAGVDPRWGRDGFELFVRGVEQYGFAGMKLYPPCGYRADSELLEPFYEYCEAYRLPVLLHVGPTSPVLPFGDAAPQFVDEPARRYKNIPFILAHGAVSHRDECVALCQYRPNVHLDLSGAQRSAADEHGARELLRLFKSGINHKIIYGTDWPLNAQAAVNQKLVSLLSSDGIPVKERDAILAGNMARILAGALRGGSRPSRARPEGPTASA